MINEYMISHLLQYNYCQMQMSFSTRQGFDELEQDVRLQENFEQILYQIMRF